MLLAMTWPDDPSIPVDWLFNEVYEPARAGEKGIEWIEFWTTDNQNIDQEAVAQQASKWSKEIANVRIYGRPIRFSNRIHPEFTDVSKTWCFKCQKSIISIVRPIEQLGSPPQVCPECYSDNILEYNHVVEFETGHAWPTVFILDPHPRKPHMYLWVQITPSDDWQVVADGQLDGDCTEVRIEVEKTEIELGLYVVARLVDPNMGKSPASQQRGVTWQDEFGTAGLLLDLADDSSVGRSRINTMLKPDPDTFQPRLIFHPRCRDTIYQMNRYTWSDYKKSIDKDQKQQPSDKYNDFPTCLKYLANMEPSFHFLKEGGQIVGRGKRTGAY